MLLALLGGASAASNLPPSLPPASPSQPPPYAPSNTPQQYTFGWQCQNQLYGSPVLRIPGSASGDWGKLLPRNDLLSTADQAASWNDACKALCNQDARCRFVGPTVSWGGWCYIYDSSAEVAGVCQAKLNGDSLKKSGYPPSPSPPSPPSPPPPPPPCISRSRNTQCGSAFGACGNTYQPLILGRCCSQFNWCGEGSAYCGAGNQAVCSS